MQLLSILKRIYKHPFNSNDRIGSLLRFFKWQINCRLNPYPIVYPYTENSKLIIERGLTGATGNLYSGLMEYEEMGYSIDSGVEVLVKVYEGVMYILAANTSVGPAKVTFSNLPLPADSLEVLFEERSLDVSDDSFHDTFKPYEVHVYKSIEF